VLGRCGALKIKNEQVTNAERIKSLVIEFEKNQISSEFALEEINKYSNQRVDIGWLSSYQSSIGLDMFVRILTIALIEEDCIINDDKAIVLLQEILNNIGDDALLHMNFEALEKRYSKSTGTISNWIFYEDITDTSYLLKLLKTNSSITL